MTPSEFVDLAHRLAEADDSGAAGYRSAISRAYYGAYLSAKALVEGLQIPCRAKDRTSDHMLLQKYLINCQVPLAVELGYLLSNLQEARKKADYEMNLADVEQQDESKLSVARAFAILSKIEDCHPVAIKQKLKAGITQYRQANKMI